jgi:hypothetical protein
MIEVKRPVLFCGENPGMTLYEPATERVVAVASYWQCIYSPLGRGAVLIVWSEQLLVQGRPGGIFADNLPLAHMLVETLTQHFPEFRAVPLDTLSYIPAQSQQHWDGAQHYTVTSSFENGEVTAEWAAPLDYKQLTWPQFPAGGQTFFLSTVICPCRQASIALNGKPVDGEVRLSEQDGQPLSSAFLAFAETWVGP